MRCVTATAFSICLLCSTAPAQDESSEARQISATESAKGLPNRAQVSQAFERLRGWISAFDTPRMEDLQSQVQIDGATGVCIVLRRSGRVMGVGVDRTGDALMLRRAAGAALNQVLADPALSSLTARLVQQQNEHQDDALSIEALREDVGRSLAIELEVSGPLSPLVGRTLEQLSDKINPGDSGIALRQGQSWEFLFPAQMRSSNTGSEPGKFLMNFALRNGLPIDNITDLINRDDVGLYRFQTITLWQGDPGTAPMFTFRGDIIVDAQSVTRPEVLNFADRLASHLMQRMWPEPPAAPVDPAVTGPQPALVAPARLPVGIMGDYRPISDQFRPLIAPPLDQALAAFALAKYANVNAADGDAQLKARAMNAARQILADLSEVTPAEDDPRRDLAACAAIIYAVSADAEALKNTRIKQLFDDAVLGVTGAFTPAAGFVDRLANRERARAVSSHTQAMLAGALARLLHLNVPTTINAELVRQAIDSAWSSAPMSEHVALLPWIGWAERDWSSAAAQQSPKLNDLRALLLMLDAARITQTTILNEDLAPDLQGSFALTSDAVGNRAASAATSQALRPAAWTASILKDERLINPEQIKAVLAGHLTTMRFLLQLSVREANRGMYRNHDRAAGGIRAALWDSDQPGPAQALGLLTAVQTLENWPELD